MTMSERDLRLFWEQQHLDATRLRTTDGRRVVVYAPGTENTDGGPDFRDARIRIGNTTYVGDVEVHLRTGQWRAHRHHTDPHYNSVILHVVHTDDGSHTRTARSRRIPVVAIGRLIAGMPPRPVPSAPRHRIALQDVRTLARSLGRQRLLDKARRAEDRLREIVGEDRFVEGPASADLYSQPSGEACDQLLYEGLLEAMGYAKNRAPFLLLARSVRLRTLRRFDLHDRETMSALLFGAAGLLPPIRTVADAESRACVRRLRTRWAGLRPSLRVEQGHPADWLFFRLRPANFPPVRLAAVVDLLPVLFGNGELRRLVRQADDLPPAAWWREARALFAVPPDPFWSRHVRFAAPVRTRRTCLGQERLLDIAANVLVPSALLLHRLSGDCDADRCAALLDHLPAAGRDVLVRSLARTFREPLRPASMLEHQGLIELAIRT